MKSMTNSFKWIVKVIVATHQFKREQQVFQPMSDNNGMIYFC